jgi:Fe-Mn family superoxide dismutase
MPFELRPLPFDKAALEPAMSARTLEFHHGKHHAGYVNKLNELIQGTDLANASLESVIQRTVGKQEQGAQQIFNNAAQVWNHDFFWNSLAPNGGGEIPEPIRKQFEQAFGSVQNFRDRFLEAAVGRFGSGWAWLVLQNGKLAILSTANAEVPFTSGAHPLLTCDVWEHAYYLDYQNDRAAFVKAFLDTVANWQFVSKRLSETKAA